MKFLAFVFLVAIELFQAFGAEDKSCVDEANAERARSQLTPLEVNKKLVEVAKAHNEWMMSHNCFKPECPGETTIGERVKASEYSYSAIAETVSANNNNCGDAVKSWFKSESRDYILGKFVDIGCDVKNCTTKCDYKVYYTCIYGKPMSETKRN